MSGHTPELSIAGTALDFSVRHLVGSAAPRLADVLGVVLQAPDSASLPGTPELLELEAGPVAVLSSAAHGLGSGRESAGTFTDDEHDSEIARTVQRDAALSHLAVLAAAGDHAALDRLLTKVRPPVVRYCRARLGSSGVGLQQAEDVAQNVLLALCGAIPRYRAGETRVMAFVYGIASNKVVDAFRAAGRDHSEPTDDVPDFVDPARGPEPAAVLRTQIDELWALLDLLPAPQREVLVMRVAMRFSAEETARVIGSTAGAVRVTQHRALAKLRAKWSGDHRDDVRLPAGPLADRSSAASEPDRGLGHPVDGTCPKVAR